MSLCGETFMSLHLSDIEVSSISPLWIIEWHTGIRSAAYGKLFPKGECTLFSPLSAKERL